MVTTATPTGPVVQYGVAMVPRPQRSPLGELLRDNDSMMRAVAYRMVGANQLDDTMQEAYLRAVRSYGTFRGQSSFRTWLYRIVHNTCVDVIRRDRRHQLVTGTDGPGLERAASLQPSNVFEQPEGSEIEQALAQLPEDQRVAMTLVGIVGLSYDEAAEILDVPRGTVATRVHRGRAELKRALSEEVT